MKPYQERVVAERNELHERVAKLNDFIAYDQAFNTIDPDEQERLKVQNDIMWQYYEILTQRIKNFKD